mmetsp:Transcript_59064/g.50038  ORF Transcript_59064/g.50038 Transcript_59064/m.50038 type:complete len:92 (-) Transcript_59064:336-611(-)
MSMSHVSNASGVVASSRENKRRVSTGRDAVVSAKDATTNAKDAATSAIQKRSRASIPCCVLLQCLLVSCSVLSCSVVQCIVKRRAVLCSVV